LEADLTLVFIVFVFGKLSFLLCIKQGDHKSRLFNEVDCWEFDAGLEEVTTAAATTAYKMRETPLEIPPLVLQSLSWIHMLCITCDLS